MDLLLLLSGNCGNQILSFGLCKHPNIRRQHAPNARASNDFSVGGEHFQRAWQEIHLVPDVIDNKYNNPSTHILSSPQPLLETRSVRLIQSRGRILERASLLDQTSQCQLFSSLVELTCCFYRWMTQCLTKTCFDSARAGDETAEHWVSRR